MSVAIRPAATLADVDTAVEILVDAFYDDPAWSFGFPDPAKRREQQGWFWRLCALESFEHSTLYLTTNGASAAVWQPPGVFEGGDPDEFAAEARSVMGSDASRFLRSVERFEANQPRDEHYYYLSLLGTHTSQQGHSYGLGLLAATLEIVDDAGMPAYLEASHHDNIPLYERYGFAVRGGFDMPDDGPHVATMWRDPR